MMTKRPRRFAAVAPAAAAAGCLLLAACSSSSHPLAGPSSTPVVEQPTAGSSAGASASSSGGPAGGGGTANSGSAAPCSLLTQAEVDTAAGQPLGPGKPVPGTSLCLWASSDSTAHVTSIVTVWSSVKAAATARGQTLTSVAGVGDEALSYYDADAGEAGLSVRKGSTGFLLVIRDPHIDSLPDHGLAAEKVLAAAVLGRL